MLKKFKRYDRVIKELFVLSLSTVFESFLFQMITFFDNFMISFLGSAQVTGASLANRINFIFFIIVFVLSTSLGAYVSQAFSKN